ncbi:hypothetical protein [Thermosipho melanesiensis]|uniref:Uncharacterized protein n=1 Tax=Thermosipho melanesiensis (strain DSM 12029 / CIP 104789 / BI429) TaxID=391009 RepID=A6LK69_THEM4|nr:hypothetical protein [Thermosipho melanesiensis]ABR30320.1 hypothetical protein Tmel_0453 [Thermosipho melanesiensis BI429]
MLKNIIYYVIGAFVILVIIFSINTYIQANVSLYTPNLILNGDKVNEKLMTFTDNNIHRFEVDVDETSGYLAFAVTANEKVEVYQGEKVIFVVEGPDLSSWHRYYYIPLDKNTKIVFYSRQIGGIESKWFVGNLSDIQKMR